MGTLQQDAKTLDEEYKYSSNIHPAWHKIRNFSGLFREESFSYGAREGVNGILNVLRGLTEMPIENFTYGQTLAPMTSQYLREVHAEIKNASRRDLKGEATEEIALVTEFVRKFERFIAVHRDEIAAAADHDRERHKEGSSIVSYSGADIYSPSLLTRVRDRFGATKGAGAEGIA